MDQCLQIVWRNQEIIHSQRDEPLQEFPASLSSHPSPTPTAALGIGPVCVSSDDDNEAQAAADEEMEDDE
jgi:hypothetical protein